MSVEWCSEKHPETGEIARPGHAFVDWSGHEDTDADAESEGSDRYYDLHILAVAPTLLTPAKCRDYVDIARVMLFCRFPLRLRVSDSGLPLFPPFAEL